MSVEEEKKAVSKSVLDEDRISIPVIKYFWQASPLASAKTTSIHKFLRKVACFDHFSDFELYLFSQFLHLRNYASQEIVFREGDGGFAFYLLLDGIVDVYTSTGQISGGEEKSLVAQLNKFDFFGELAMIEENNIRNATAVTTKNTTLLTIYKPDLEELIERHPVVGAKLIQGLSTIVAKRFKAIAVDLKVMKEKVKKLEEDARKEQIQGQ